MTLTIASWNINSVRLRLPLIRRLIKAVQPDVVCLQETKVTDEAFPHGALRRMGFSHRHAQGMKSYNGVAILSRVPLTDTGTRSWCGRDDCRHVFATVPGGIEVHSVYVPSGGDIPDPEQNDKFAHKLRFLDELTAWWRDRATPRGRRVMVGDFNIAPLEWDVWSHKQLVNVVSHTPIEVERLAALQAAHDWVDGVRHFVPAPEKLYTWWSYRARDWQASDRGRRLDHVWVTPALKRRLKSAMILKAARGWPKASDHVPVVVQLET